MTDKSLHTMEIGEELAYRDEYLVLRVPGGWMFRHRSHSAACFVPWSEEGREQATATDQDGPRVRRL